MVVTTWVSKSAYETQAPAKVLICDPRIGDTATFFDLALDGQQGQLDLVRFSCVRALFVSQCVALRSTQSGATWVISLNPCLKHR